MKYMIVGWTEDKWIIFHYSHDFDDADHWYKIYKAKCQKTKLMIDIYAFEEREQKEQLKKTLERLMQ